MKITQNRLDSVLLPLRERDHSADVRAQLSVALLESARRSLQR